jgi:hypothetical protein
MSKARQDRHPMNIVVTGPKARVRIHHEVAYDRDPKTGLWLTRAIDEDEEVENLILNAGRVQLHAQCYKAAGLLTNGFNYIGLSNDVGSPNATDTTLTGEISGDGLDRAQGTITPPTGSGNQTQVQKVFTYVGSTQGVQKSALFTATVGVMAHEVTFTPRLLGNGDTLTVTYTITLG